MEDRHLPLFIATYSQLVAPWNLEQVMDIEKVAKTVDEQNAMIRNITRCQTNFENSCFSSLFSFFKGKYSPRIH